MGISSGRKSFDSAADLISWLTVGAKQDRQVRVFRDMNGDISFATPEDVLIAPDDDARVHMISQLVPKLDDASIDQLECYEGSLDSLLSSVLKKLSR